MLLPLGVFEQMIQFVQALFQFGIRLNFQLFVFDQTGDIKMGVGGHFAKWVLPSKHGPWISQAQDEPSNPYTARVNIALRAYGWKLGEKWTPWQCWEDKQAFLAGGHDKADPRKANPI